MAKRRWLAGALAGFVIAAPAAAGEPGLPQSGEACPTRTGCIVASGSYRIVLPAQAVRERPVGAIMYFHGYQGSAEETIADPGLLAVAGRLGVALVAAEGAGHSWSYPGSPAQLRDEFAYVGQVLDDVAARFPVDSHRVMASGFSQGGSMVWYLACRMPARFAAFAPIAGAFWEPLPARCDGPRPPLIHVHGTSDMTVPLAGRALRSGARQGDVFRSFAIIAPGGCTAAFAETARRGLEAEEIACHLATGCDGPARLELCLHAGGHRADPAWVERAWRLAMPAGGPLSEASGPLTSP